eukprot:4879424-Prorocentrum_lima.AAC.1
MYFTFGQDSKLDNKLSRVGKERDHDVYYEGGTDNDWEDYSQEGEHGNYHDEVYYEDDDYDDFDEMNHEVFSVD